MSDVAAWSDWLHVAWIFFAALCGSLLGTWWMLRRGK